MILNFEIKFDLVLFWITPPQRYAKILPVSPSTERTKKNFFFLLRLIIFFLQNNLNNNKKSKKKIFNFFCLRPIYLPISCKVNRSWFFDFQMCNQKSRQRKFWAYCILGILWSSRTASSMIEPRNYVLFRIFKV